MDYVQEQIKQKKIYLDFLEKLLTCNHPLISHYLNNIHGLCGKEMIVQPVTDTESDYFEVNVVNDELKYERQLYDLEQQIRMIKRSVEYNLIISRDHSHIVNELKKSLSDCFPVRLTS